MTALTGSVSIQQLIELALDASTADRCVVIGQERTEANLRWAGNSLTTNGQMHSRRLTVISIRDGADGSCVGVVSRPVTSPAEVSALVADSELAAEAASPADDVSPLVEPGPDDRDEQWSGAATTTGIEVFADFAPALGEMFAAAGASDRLLYGFAEHVLTSSYLASSTGLRRHFDQHTGRVEINAKSADLTRSAWVGAQTQDFSDVDVRALAAELDRRLDWAANQIDLPAGRYETLLPPSAVADLMVYLYWTMSARDAEEGRTVFSAPGGGTRIGELLSELGITLRSDPADPAMPCLPFELNTASGVESVFDNGAPVPATEWISAGRLANLQRTRNWAARTNAEHVPFVDNLILQASPDGSGSSLAEMIAGTERGLLVTCLWYIRQVDPQTLLLTGLTRDGVYLIEHGEVVGVVNNFRFNESPVDLLTRVTEVGATEPTLPREWSDYFTRAAMPAIRVPDFNMSTVSQAS